MLRTLSPVDESRKLTCGAGADGVAAACLDDGRAGEQLLEDADPGFVHALLLAGRVVLGVLGEVPFLARGLDRRDDRRAPDLGQLLELGLGLARPFGLIAFFTSSFTAPEGSGSDSDGGILREDIWGRFRFDVDLFASVLRVEDPGLAS